MDGLLQKTIAMIQKKVGYYMSVCMFFLPNFLLTIKGSLPNVPSKFVYHKFSGMVTTHRSVGGLIKNIEEGQNLKSE